MRPPARKPTRASKPASMGSVRIIGGRWRGTRLALVDADGLRPSSDRMRETLFNWLQPHLLSAKVLDAFAGSGALGLEAISRGAAHASLIEREARQVTQLSDAVQRLNATSHVRVCRADALQWLQAAPDRQFDIAFIDPPFAAQLWGDALQRMQPWLSADALVYVESPSDAPFAPGAGWQLRRQTRTRHAHGALYRRDGTQVAATLASHSTP